MRAVAVALLLCGCLQQRTTVCADGLACPDGYACVPLEDDSERFRCAVENSCGNGIPEGAEECDDGNTVGGDGCTPDCKITSCGNGVLDTFEACDPTVELSSGQTCLTLGRDFGVPACNSLCQVDTTTCGTLGWRRIAVGDVQALDVLIADSGEIYFLYTDGIRVSFEGGIREELEFVDAETGLPQPADSGALFETSTGIVAVTTQPIDGSLDIDRTMWLRDDAGAWSAAGNFDHPGWVLDRAQSGDDLYLLLATGNVAESGDESDILALVDGRWQEVTPVDLNPDADEYIWRSLTGIHAAQDGTLYATQYNGVLWQRQNDSWTATPPGPVGTSWDVWGENGEVHTVGGDISSGARFSSWNGSSWTETPSSDEPLPQRPFAYRIIGDSSNLIAVGGGGFSSAPIPGPVIGGAAWHFDGDLWAPSLQNWPDALGLLSYRDGSTIAVQRSVGHPLSFDGSFIYSGYDTTSDDIAGSSRTRRFVNGGTSFYDPTASGGAGDWTYLGACTTCRVFSLPLVDLRAVADGLMIRIQHWNGSAWEDGSTVEIRPQFKEFPDAPPSLSPVATQRDGTSYIAGIATSDEQKGAIAECTLTGVCMLVDPGFSIWPVTAAFSRGATSWFGTAGGTLLSYDGTTWSGEQVLLPSETISALWVDQDETRWIGTTAGEVYGYRQGDEEPTLELTGLGTIFVLDGASDGGVIAVGSEQTRQRVGGSWQLLNLGVDPIGAIIVGDEICWIEPLPGATVRCLVRGKGL